MLDGIPDWASSYRLFSPLYGLMASRYRRGDAVTTAPVGRDFHPHGCQVVKVRLGLLPLSEPCQSSLSITTHFD